jgi:hypothetical protein
MFYYLNFYVFLSSNRTYSDCSFFQLKIPSFFNDSQIWTDLTAHFGHVVRSVWIPGFKVLSCVVVSFSIQNVYRLQNIASPNPLLHILHLKIV